MSWRKVHTGGPLILDITAPGARDLCTLPVGHMALVADKVISGEFLPEFRGPPTSHLSTGTSYWTSSGSGTYNWPTWRNSTEVLHRPSDRTPTTNKQTNERDPPALNNVSQRNWRTNLPVGLPCVWPLALQSSRNPLGGFKLWCCERACNRSRLVQWLRLGHTRQLNVPAHPSQAAAI